MNVVSAGQMSHLKVLMVDPSLFTYPYDSSLVRALNALCEVKLIGRTPREYEWNGILEPFPVTSLFYKSSEKFRTRRMSAHLVVLIKVIEHCFDFSSFVRYARLKKPDAIHFQWLPIPSFDRFFVRQLKRVCPVFLTLHDLTPFNGNPTSRFQALGFNAALKEFSGLFVHTNNAVETLRNFGLNTTQICHVGIPPDIETITPFAGTESHSSEISTSPPKKVNVLILGLLKEYKGIDIAIKAMGLLPPSVKNRVHLTIAGEPKMPMGPLFDLQKRLPKPDQVEWRLKFLSPREMMVLMDSADIFLFAYRKIEGSGVFSQSLRFEKPIIATNIGIFAETIQRTGCGLPVEPIPEDIASKLTLMITDKDIYNQCKEGAKIANGMLPSWVNVANETLKFYRQTILGMRTGHQKQ